MNGNGRWLQLLISMLVTINMMITGWVVNQLVELSQSVAVIQTQIEIYHNGEHR